MDTMKLRREAVQNALEHLDINSGCANLGNDNIGCSIDLLWFKTRSKRSTLCPGCQLAGEIHTDKATIFTR